LFEPISSRINFPQLEMSVLDFWKQRGIINRSMREREGNPSYVFYEGPPTANGLPGTLSCRAFKDLFPRYKTMHGYYCLRRGGIRTACRWNSKSKKNSRLTVTRSCWLFGDDSFPCVSSLVRPWR
jgi:hypothetical protein